MKFTKQITLHNININLSTNSYFIIELIASHLVFPKFKIHYKKYLTVALNIEKTNHFPHGRSDSFVTNNNKLSLECWLKNIYVKVSPKKNIIAGKIINETILSPDAIFDLLFIHPLRHILKYKNICLIHAAVLAKNSKGVLICGSFKSGKSTLAVKLVEDGLKFLSDEFIIFDKRKLISFPLNVGLHIKSLKLFSRLQKLTKHTHNNQNKIHFNIEDFYPNCLTENCIPEIIIFPTPQTESKKVTLTAVNKKTAFLMLCKDKDNSLPFEKNIIAREKQIQSLATLAEKTQAYRLFYSLEKLDEVSKIINNLLACLT